MKATIFSIWLLLGLGYWYIANNYCDTQSATTIISEVKSPFYFEENESDIIPTEHFIDYNAQLNLDYPKGSQIAIIGHMTSDEHALNANIGIERAQSLKNHLELTDYEVTLQDEIVDELGPNGQYVSIKMLNEIASDVSSNSEEPSGESDELVVENHIDDKSSANVAKHATIYFPFNSTQKLEREETNAYLNGIAKRVLGTGETIVLTGYADIVGSRSYNYRLGEKRAYAIKYYLVSRGVNPRKILTISKGEGYTQGSEEDDDRQDDRKVELLLLN